MDNLDNKDDDLKRGPGPDNPEEGKPEAAPNPPEDHDDGKKEEKKRGKKNPYDQYKYWGSDGDGPSSGGPKFKGGRPNRVALIIFILLIASFIYMIFTDSSVSRQSTTVSYSQFVNAVESNAVADVTILDNVNIEFTYSNGMSGKSRIPWFVWHNLCALIGMENLATRRIRSSGSIWCPCLFPAARSEEEKN